MTFIRNSRLGCVIFGILAGSVTSVAAEPADTKSSDTDRSTPIFHQERDAEGLPVYRIYPLRNGVCKVRGDHAHYQGNRDKIYDYALYVWLILGGEKPILLDAGLNDVAEMNRGAKKVLYEPITQGEDETVTSQLRKFGLTHADIGHIFVTHLHFDHVDGLLDFPNAKIHMGRKEWELATDNDCIGSWGHGPVMFTIRDDPKWNSRLVLHEDEVVFPGFETFWVGGHTPGSQAYRLNTKHGKVVMTGDTVSLLENIDRPVGVYSDIEQVKSAMKKIRSKADIVLPSHDPGTLDRWPPAAQDAPKYTIRAIKVGECDVIDGITFQDRFHETTTRPYYLYVWVIEGGEKPIVVETGPNPKYLENFNESTAAYIPGGVRQAADEDTPDALRKAGIDPDDVSHVIATHLHGDHYDYFTAFPNAKFVVNATEFQDGISHMRHAAPTVFDAVTSRRGVLHLVGDDEELLPGIRLVRLGCHTRGSQGVLVTTHMGPALLAGDVVYMYDNIEQDRPGRSPDPGACYAAYGRIRAMADIILPAHDPLTLKRWPEGLIGGLPGMK